MGKYYCVGDIGFMEQEYHIFFSWCVYIRFDSYRYLRRIHYKKI